MDIFESFRQFLINGEPDEYTTPVAVLKPEDIMRAHAFRSKRNAVHGELKVLEARALALNAEMNSHWLEFWEHLYKTYNLPREKEYRLDDRYRRILKRTPKAGS